MITILLNDRRYNQSKRDHTCVITLRLLHVIGSCSRHGNKSQSMAVAAASSCLTQFEHTQITVNTAGCGYRHHLRGYMMCLEISIIRSLQ